MCRSHIDSISFPDREAEKNKTLFLHSENSDYKLSDENLSASASLLSATEAT